MVARKDKTVMPRWHSRKVYRAAVGGVMPPWKKRYNYLNRKRWLRKYARSRPAVGRAQGISASYYSNRATAARNAAVGEKLYIPLAKWDQQTMTATQTGEKAHMRLYNIGTSALETGFEALGGDNVAIGNAANQRQGIYSYWSHVTLDFNLDCIYPGTGVYVAPQEYRLIIGKLRTGHKQAGVTPSLATQLFLNGSGQEVGHATADINGIDLLNNTFNHKRFYIYRDIKGWLSAPQSSQVPGWTTSCYPANAHWRFKLPFNSKVRFGVNSIPEDIDSKWFIVVYTRGLNDKYDANDVAVSIRGCSTFVEN